MWMKLKYKQITPAIITRLSVFDGVLSFGLASLRGFDLKSKEDNRYKAEYGYIEDLPIKRTEYKNGWFYNISVPIFSNPRLSITYLSRKFIPDRFIYENKNTGREDIYSKKFTKEDISKGREKVIRDTYRTIESDYMYVILEAEDKDKIIDVASRIKYIGKKANSGYGEVELVGYEEVNVENFVYKDILIRPVPISLIEDRGYGIIRTRIVPPYYIPDERYEEICYIDKRLFSFKEVEIEEEEKEDEYKNS